ncbi:MAG TPA: pyrroline-5-carboxylate reductase [Acidimicrobiales bacterium]|nr:pyrroline-5-carboxylate reductase [Acidimicrobiales bacterium]
MAPSSVTGNLVVVGGGRMGEALAAGLLAQGFPTGRLVVVETSPERRRQLEARPLPVAADVKEALDRWPTGSAEPVGAVIAVKPHDVEAVCVEVAAAGVARVLSIAAGVTLEDLDRWLDPAAAIRAMPNTPALVGCAASAVAPGRRATAADVDWATSVLSAVGTVVELPEPALDAVTGLSGSGPAYVFLIAEALIDAGVLAGLSRPVARDLTVQTLLGSAHLLAETAEEPSALRAAVTSPGGTTAAGLRALESAGVRAALLEAVMAATERARELGRGR